MLERIAKPCSPVSASPSLHSACGASAFDWAKTQNNLAIAYEKRINGEQADNISGPSHYEAALTVRNREVFPTDWASTRHNLGNAYQRQGQQSDSPRC